MYRDPGRDTVSSSVGLFTFLILLTLTLHFMSICTCVDCCVEVRGQPAGVGSVLLLYVWVHSYSTVFLLVLTISAILRYPERQLQVTRNKAKQVENWVTCHLGFEY